MDRLDGNAAAGILQELFLVEMTTVEATCAGCGQMNVVGAFMVYKHGMGTIIRCPSCDTPIIRVAQPGGHYRLDLRGCRLLEFVVEA
jgi:hypothetical protein